MKKLTIVCLMALFAMATVAQETPTLKEIMQRTVKKEQLQEKHQPKVSKYTVARTEESVLPTAQPAAKAVAEIDTVELEFDGFYDDPLYYDAGDWYFVLRNERYQFIFDVFGGTPEDPSGTYTEDDLDIWFSWCMFPEANGSTHYYKSCDLTIKMEKTSNMVKYIVDAVVVVTEGIGGEVYGAFKLHAEHKTISASTKMDVAILGCTVTPEDDRFRLYGKNDTMEVDMTLFSEFGVEGYYNHNYIDYDNTNIVYRGQSYEVMEMEGIIYAAELTTGGVAYVAMMEILTTDTTFFNIAMEAPIIPTDTIEFNCINLELDASQGMSQGTIQIFASNKNYSLWAAYNANKITVPADYVGTSFSGQAMAYLTELATEKEISAFTTKIHVDKNSAGEYTVDLEMLGSDHKYYKMHLTWYIPVAVDTVILHFENNSKSMFYIDDLGLREVQLANYEGNYSVSFDILYIDQVMGGEFTTENLWMEQTFITEHTEEGDVYVDFAELEGSIYQRNDTTYLTAQVLGLDSIFYDIEMFYAVPTPTEVVECTFTKDNVLFTNALPQGIFILEGMNEDGTLMATIQVNRIENEKLEDTFINDGHFGENHFDATNTYIQVWDENIEDYVTVYPQQGEMTVSVDANKNLLAVGSFICDDAKQYNLTFHAQYERAHLPYDKEYGELEYTYDEKSIVTIKDWIAGYQMIYLELVPEDYSNVSAFYFNADAMDPALGIPAGVYPINNSYESGSVVASRGIAMDGYPLESYFCELQVEEDEDGELALYYNFDELYCLVDGTVTVEHINGALKIEVDAVNSYDVPVKLHYNADLTSAIDNIGAETVGTEKRIVNGQMLIIRNGKTFNAMGAQVK